MHNNANPTSHDLLNTVARCLSGDWLIEPTWLFTHAALMARADQGVDMSAVWPKQGLSYMVNQDGGFQSAARDGITGKGTALGVISVIGPIYKYGWNSSKTFLYYLDQLAKDDQVGAVKIKVDTPGGQNAGTREVYQAIMNFPKPVLVAVDGYMASAGLYQMAGATKIVATQPTDQIGSLGTYNSYADWNAYYASFGLKMYETYAPESTEKNEEYRQIIESQGKKRELVEAYLKVLNDQFIADVRAGRGKQLNKSVEKGRLYFADPDATKMGLIDELISEGETLALLADMQLTTKQTTIQMGLIDQLIQELGGKKAGQQNDAPTVEQLTAQVTQLTSERDGALGQVTAMTSQVTELTTQVTTLTTERDAAQASVTTLTTERDALQAKVTEYGAQPGAMGSQVSKNKDEIPAGPGDQKTLQQIIDELPSEKEAAAAGY